MASALETRDHGKIRDWIEKRGGRPAQVKGAGGLLRIDFGEPEEKPKEISWGDLFSKFDASSIPFLYDPEPKSRFNKFVRD